MHDGLEFYFHWFILAESLIGFVSLVIVSVSTFAIHHDPNRNPRTLGHGIHLWFLFLNLLEIFFPILQVFLWFPSVSYFDFMCFLPLEVLD